MKTLFLLCLATLSCIACGAQTSVELDIGTSGFNCGRVTTVDYCYGIPTKTLDEAGNPVSHGSIWLDAQTCNAAGYCGFIIVNGTNYPITSPFVPVVSGARGSLNYTFPGGTITLDYSTYYSAGGGGRGGAGAGYRWVVLPTSSLTLN